MSAASPPTSTVSRRVFLMAGSALAIGVSVQAGLSNLVQAAPSSSPFEPNAFIRIDADGAVTLTMARVEMGQGIYTALSMLIAEELEVPLSRVRFQHAPPDAARYGNPRAGGAPGRLAARPARGEPAGTHGGIKPAWAAR